MSSDVASHLNISLKTTSQSTFETSSQHTRSPRGMAITGHSEATPGMITPDPTVIWRTALASDPVRGTLAENPIPSFTEACNTSSFLALTKYTMLSNTMTLNAARILTVANYPRALGTLA